MNEEILPEENAIVESKLEFDLSNTVAILVEDAWKSIYKSIGKKVKNVQIKKKIDGRQAFLTYLERAFNRYSRIKTILFTKEPQYIYDFFEPMDLVCGLSRNKISSKEITDILEQGNKLIITGTGGIGKSTMLKHIFISTMNYTKLIPIYIELRFINEEEIGLLEFIYRRMKILGFSLECEYFLYSIDAGCYLFLFDGFDEIELAQKRKISKQLRELSDKYPQNIYIVSSRPSEEFIGWNDFNELQARGLTKEQAVSLINKTIYDKDVKRSFIDELVSRLFDEYKTFASIPLLLNIMLLTFEAHASLPTHISEFYDQAFSVLFDRHDATKEGVFRREIHSRLSYSDFRRVFSHFCFRTYFDSRISFKESDIHTYMEISKHRLNLPELNVQAFIYDAIHAVCMFTKDGLELVFTHRSFQEYFSALYTMELPDDTQKIILKSEVITRGLQDSSSNYLALLYDLQKKRVEKNFILPYLERWRNLFEHSDKSDKWIVLFFVTSIGKGQDGSFLVIQQQMSISGFVSLLIYVVIIDQDCLNHLYQSRTI